MVKLSLLVFKTFKIFLNLSKITVFQSFFVTEFVTEIAMISLFPCCNKSNTIKPLFCICYITLSSTYLHINILKLKLFHNCPCNFFVHKSTMVYLDRTYLLSVPMQICCLGYMSNLDSNQQSNSRLLYQSIETLMVNLP